MCREGVLLSPENNLKYYGRMRSQSVLVQYGPFAVLELCAVTVWGQNSF